MFTDDTLKGRTALITGGGSGIGLEIATHYARVGASVMLVGRNEDRIEAAVKAITAEGGKAAAWRADVRNYDELQAAIQGTVERFGGLDILINNAAGNFVCPTAELSPRGWKTTAAAPSPRTMFSRTRRPTTSGWPISTMTATWTCALPIMLEPLHGFT